MSIKDNLFDDILENTVEVDQKKETPQDETAILRQAAEGLMKAANDSANRSAILKDVEHSLSQVRMIDYPDLIESPAVKAFLQAMGVSDLKPGEVRNRGTIAEREREWDWKDLNGMEVIKFTPNETLDITFQGLCLRVTRDEECEIPRPFYDIYMDHKKALKQANINEAYLLGISDDAPHPNWQCPEGYAVRAYSIMGRAYGKRGGHIGVGPILRGDESKAAE